MRQVGPLALVVLLAGCTAGVGGQDGPQESDLLRDPASGTGPVSVGKGDAVLRIVVVDDAIRPLPGAVVAFNGTGHEATTGVSGEARFTGLEPGVYLVGVRKPGYLAARLAVTVPSAGEEDPGPVLAILTPDASVGAYVQVTKHEFYFYAAYKAGADGAPSLGAVSVIDRDELELPDGLPAWLQTEAFWEPRQPLGQNLQISFVVCRGDVVGFCTPVTGTAGPSPVYVGSSGASLQEIGYDEEGEVATQVYPSYPEPAGATVFVDQTVSLVTHAFYGFEPPPGWRFSKDGDALPP